MKRILFAALVAASLASCAKTDHQAYTISGTVSGVDGQTVTLRSTKDTLASAVVENGQFTLTGNVDNVDVVYAIIDRQHSASLVLEPGTITVNLNNGSATGTALNDALEEVGNRLNAVMTAANDPAANMDSLEQVYTGILTDAYKSNDGNVLGLYFLKSLADDMEVEELERAMNANALYSADESLQRVLTAKKAASASAVGNPYIDVKGTNATTGEAMSLSDVVAQGKPVVVDFWASWCGPCRREINDYLSHYAEQYRGKVNFVGIAVWENAVADTQKAMGELPITWPVIYAGGREDSSATDAYGINAIPHIMLIAADGTILARNIRGTQIADAIEQALAK